MKFLSIYPSLKLVLRMRKRLVDEYTKAVMFENQSLIIPFSVGVYETDDMEIITLMLERLEKMKVMRMSPSYSVYPGDEKEAKRILDLSKGIIEADFEHKKEATKEQVPAPSHMEKKKKDTDASNE